MKRSRRRLLVPKFEFGFSADSFRLIQETGIDGERLTRERDRADHAQKQAEAAQAALFPKRKRHE